MIRQIKLERRNEGKETCIVLPPPFLFDELDLWISVNPVDGPLNMAFDETLMHTSTRPVLRVYRWPGPAVSFGYPQRWRDVEPHLAGRPAVRRWTGGGLVEHGHDLTISLVIPVAYSPAQWGAGEVYEKLHEAAAAALRPILPDVRAAAPHDLSSGTACFTHPAAGDLLAGERKILGGAQRRTKWGILYQGSLQLPEFPTGFVPDFASSLASACELWEPSARMIGTARDLAKSRYATDDWTMLR